jgi:N-acetylmuramoyl-L-alanine amidase
MRMPRLVARIVTLVFVESLAACSSVGTHGATDTSKTFSTIVVDAGQGGKDSGAFRRYGPPEKMVALDVAQRIDRKLRESNIKTVMTRDSDVFIPLNNRVTIGSL